MEDGKKDNHNKLSIFPDRGGHITQECHAFKYHLYIQYHEEAFSQLEESNPKTNIYRKHILREGSNPTVSSLILTIPFVPDHNKQTLMT